MFFSEVSAPEGEVPAAATHAKAEPVASAATATWDVNFWNAGDIG